MKKIIYIIAVGLMSQLAIPTSGYAQTPNAIPYQAAARNSSGNLIASQNISLRFTLHDGTSTGSVVYQETQSVTTNVLGLFSVNIGQGIPVSGNFTTINWGSGAKFTQVEMDAAGGNSYIDMGTQQMMSVPYALYAAHSNDAGPAGATGATGANGTDGTNGAQGIQGIAGATGANGTNGLIGVTGANGIDGTNGTNGTNGAQGPIGLTGATGANGTNGTNGLIGATGEQGTQGLTGATGTNGTNGTNGLIGATGEQGTQGLTGATGANGTNGLVGATGVQGLTGASGTNGTNGLVGATGAQGTQGLTGASGTNGTNGLVGATGAQGTQGLTGATGTNGTNGTNGLVGATGAQGTQGLTGASGTNGTNGLVGATGAQGTQGVTGATGGYPVHTIGENYMGGKVFFVYDNGQHGLIAATADQSTSIKWYPGTNGVATFTNSLALGLSVGSGSKNTAIIIANQGLGDGTNYAARICNEYYVTIGGVNYGDWYLPSHAELLLLYYQRSAVGSFSTGYYWSSSEVGNSSAYSLNFNDGTMNNYNWKGDYKYVRAIRAF